MTLGRLARTRPISWLAAILWMSAVAAAITQSRASANGHGLEHVVIAHGDALPAVARSSTTGVLARLIASHRSAVDVVFAPPERITVHFDDEHGPQRSGKPAELTVALRPRRLAFRYDATAPPRVA